MILQNCIKTFPIVRKYPLGPNKIKLKKEQQFYLKKCNIIEVFKKILGSASFLARKPWKMARIQKFLRIMFINDKWHQNFFSSAYFENSGILPLPLAHSEVLEDSGFSNRAFGLENRGSVVRLPFLHFTIPFIIPF